MDLFDNAEVISAYTRRQAIEDGVLVDLMQPDTVSAVQEAGFRHAIAMTSAAFNATVWPIDDDRAADWLAGKGQDLQGRLWDVLWMLKLAIRGATDTDIIYFQVSVIDHELKRRNTVTLKSWCHPGDQGEPVITIMLPGED
jgi:hypothetical protein